MAGTPHYLVSFENVKASAGGVDISSLVEIQVQATANGIPSVTLLVDAGHPGGGKTESAAAMSLGSATALYNQFRGQVRSATLSLSVTAVAQGASGTDTQTLELSGWLLTDVGLSPVQEQGVATVALTFAHPVCKAHFGGAVPGLLTREPDLSTLQGSDPLSVFVEALGAYATAARDEDPRPVVVDGAEDPALVRSRLIQHLQSATQALTSAVAWSGGGLPASSSGLDSDDIRRGLSCYAAPSGGTSVFQRLVGELIPECSLALGGDFTSGKLQLGPFIPWADASLSVADSDIISLQFPQSDPAPISGVHCLSVDTADGQAYSYQFDGAQSGKRPADIFYVGQGELDAEYLYGPIVQIGEPGWLSYVGMAQQNVTGGYMADAVGDTQTATSTDPENPTPEFAPMGNDLPSVEYSTAMLQFAKASYETLLMSEWSFAINCRLLVRGGGVICPGKVITVSGSGLTGYVTAVTHTISVASRTAHTMITCSHPRVGAPPNGLGGTNALYS